MNQLCYFEIQSSNPLREIEFYSQVFDWNFIKIEGLAIEYYQIETATLHGGLLARPAPTPPIHCGTNAFTCSFEVDDFDAVAEKILALNGKIAIEKFAIADKCWQGYFLDPDNNTFGLVQVDSNAR